MDNENENENNNDNDNKTQQIADIASALQMFQKALTALRGAGLLSGTDVPVVVSNQVPGDNSTPAEPQVAKPEASKAKRKSSKKPKVKKARVIAPDRVEPFMEWFITAPAEDLYNVKRGQWECVKGNTDEGIAHKLLFHSKCPNKTAAGNIVCLRPIGSDITLFNASNLIYATEYGAAQKAPQAQAEKLGAMPVPFEVIKGKGDGGAGLNLDKLQIVAHNASERMFIPPVLGGWQFNIVDRHFAGAAVFKIEDDYFLFDCDRRELETFGFNPFFARLPGAVNSVEEAYASLMPDEVKKAIKDGLDVKRQGEFFFVPLVDDDTVIPAKILGKNYEDKQTTNNNIYRDMCARISAAAILRMIDYREEELKDVERFVRDCDKQNDGKIALDDGSLSDNMAVKITERYRRMLAETVSWPDEALTYKDIDPDILTRTVGMLTTDGTTSHWRFGREEGPLVNWGIRIDNALGVVDDDGVTRGRHTATAIYQASPDEVYAAGYIAHSGREHSPLLLRRWHRVYANTATSNWTVSGDVD